MQLFIGTSGYSYREWLGKFYPAKWPAGKMLNYYAERFPVVETQSIKLPSDDAVDRWIRDTPRDFQFAVKAPQTITHFRRLKGVDEPLAELIGLAKRLKSRRGPLLFQLPGNFKKDLDRLTPIAKALQSARAVFEFRHASWLDDEVIRCLRTNRCALCVADSEEFPVAPLIKSCDWGYLRLRRVDYSDRDLGDWLARIRAVGWKTAYIFFKHEETGSGPRLAVRMAELAGK